MLRFENPDERSRALAQWLEEPEHTCEFKEARDSYPLERLREYCVGIANTGGGKLVLGVTDKKPRKVVGSNAFLNPEKHEANLCREFGYRLDFEEIQHPDGRVLVLHIPPHPIGRPLDIDGRFLRRAGESLVRMDAGEVARLTRGDADFTAMGCEKATMEDLDRSAIGLFRGMLDTKSPNLIRQQHSSGQLLSDYGLVREGVVTYAALLLLGSPEALARHLPQAELIFEYRADAASIRHEQRVEYRSGFLLWFADLWELINRRNTVQFVQDGFLNRSIATFNESVIREAVLNAVSHRDYQMGSSTFVRQDRMTLEIVSPGGFPAGITSETILARQYPRNRLLAEALQRCGLVERSGQGVDLMFNECLREGKQRPDYGGTSQNEVRLLLRGDVQDPKFVRFLEKVGSEGGIQFGTEDLIVLDQIARSEPVSDQYRSRLVRLEEEGVIERIGRGRGVRLLLSERFYSYLGREGLYTAKLGLARSTRKALLLEHLARRGENGAAIMELQQVLPGSSRGSIKEFLGELKNEQKVDLRGANRGSRWFARPAGNGV
jgi:ATP-dependent DNA helicase RecG